MTARWIRRTASAASGDFDSDGGASEAPEPGLGNDSGGGPEIPTFGGGSAGDDGFVDGQGVDGDSPSVDPTLLENNDAQADGAGDDEGGDELDELERLRRELEADLDNVRSERERVIEQADTLQAARRGILSRA